MGKRSRAAAVLPPTEQPNASTSSHSPSISPDSNDNNTASNDSTTRQAERVAKKARKAEKKLLREIERMNAESTHPGEMEIDQLESSPAPTQIIETSQQQREREKQQLREERKSRKASEKKRKETATLSSILEDIPGAMRSGEFEGGLGEPLKKKHKKKKDAVPDATTSTAQEPAQMNTSPPKKSKKSKKSQTLPTSASTSSSNPLASTSTNTPLDPTPQPSFLDPLFGFDFIPTNSTSSNSQAPTASTSTSNGLGNDIQVQLQDHQNTGTGGVGNGMGDYELPIPPPITSYGTEGGEGQGDIPVMGGGSDETSTAKKAKKDKKKKEKSSAKKKDKGKETARGEEEGNRMQEIEIDPQLVNEGVVPGGGEGKGKEKEVDVANDGGKEKERENGDEDDDDEEDAEEEDLPALPWEDVSGKGKGKGKARGEQVQNSTSIVPNDPSTSTHPSASPSSEPHRIRVGPIQPGQLPPEGTPYRGMIIAPLKPKPVFDPTDDSSVLTLEELEKDPEFVKPQKRTGPFWDILQTKWTPVGELRRLAAEAGETYRQGKFSNSEDRLIKATIKAFREKSGMTSAELVHHITTRRSTITSAAHAAAGVDGKKVHGGYGGPLTEMWQELAIALQERAMLGIWNRVKRMYNPDSGKGPWTPEEDEELRRAVKEYGSSSWEKIATSVERTSGDCRDRWTKQLGGGQAEAIKKGKWSKEEEQQLIELHAELGNSWTAIVKRMGGTRSATQCRIKWSDSLSRKENAPSPSNVNTPTPQPEASTSGVTVEDQKEGQADKDWKWKQEYYSTLVHAIAAMKLNNESEIDFGKITEPTLQPQGAKNLRDRFKRLRQGAITDIRERENLDKDEKVLYQTIIDRLLALYPEPGKAYKRVYRKSEKKRIEKAKAKEERKAVRAEKTRLRKEREARNGAEGLTIAQKRKVKSQAVIEDSDEEGEGESSSDDDEESDEE